MKKFLLSLLGIAMLFQFATAEKPSASSKRVIDIYEQERVLFSTSDSYSGSITKVEVYTLSWSLLLTQEYSGVYSCSTDVSTLGSGNYIVKVTTTKTSYAERFNL